MAVARDVRVLGGVEDLGRAAREEVIRLGRAAIAKRGRFTLALSGGSTPKRLYSLLERDDLDWDAVELFFGDERHVPPDDQGSNYRMVRESLLDRIAISPGRVHRIRGELADAQDAAQDYESELRRAFALRSGERPRFDLVLLGMGADGHTASLFPGSSALAERERLVAATWVEKLGTWRITLTLPSLENAACALFLVAGSDKAPALANVLASAPGESELPAGRVAPRSGELIWLVDHAARPDGR